MRKFFITSGTETRGLNGEDSIFFDSPSGLGCSIGVNFSNMNNGFFLNAGPSETQGSVTGNLLFTGPEPYAGYNNFINWLLGAENPELVYQPENTPYHARVVVSSVTKGEIGKNGLLSVAVTFKLLTPWFIIERLTGSSVSVTARGQLPSAFFIRLTGATSAPVIELSDIGAAILSDAVISSDVVELSTLPYDSYITVNGADAVQGLDILSNPYFRLNARGAAVLSCNSGSMSVDVFHYWRTV